eukprot:TRINITY_DN3708_c0_g1_i1.p1 TRINITY_DN3708_c0_g1~~TRINITY_DN3708_c0_g1_i1.p1  ORF type:complete len:360 (+),score=53.03 TRINITY_DN3708_c0_g1_i1:136-1215(+)
MSHRRLSHILSQLIGSSPGVPHTIHPRHTHSQLPFCVCVTGAAGQIAYALLPLIAQGDVFGDRPLVLHLLDIPDAMTTLEGVLMELYDCAYPLLVDVIITDDPVVAFTGADFCVMLGAFPRKEGMERKDLLDRNVHIFQEQGEIINQFASRNVKVVVVGNPANTNCWVLRQHAPDIPSENFTALTRLDHNRTISQISNHLDINIKEIKNVIIWGNHSKTQYPDVNHLSVSGTRMKLSDDFVRDLIPLVQSRGAQVIKVRGKGSSLSAAKAIADHCRDWMFGTKIGEWVSMGVISDGSYGIEPGLVFSFPVQIEKGIWKIVQNLDISTESHTQITRTLHELIEEKDLALRLTMLQLTNKN